MFDPKYTVSPVLLGNIRKITSLIADLGGKNFPETVTLELERKARELSSYASTSIEGNPLPLTEVKKVLKLAPRNVRNSEKEVINYNNALSYLNSLISKDKAVFNLDLVKNVHVKVMSSLLSGKQVGNFRKEPVVINNPSTGEMIFISPDAKDVEKLMKDLVLFIQKKRNILDYLILAGIFHKEFVHIHPFIDGNGRTTRLITKLLLADMGLNTFNLFSFENYYNKDVARYFQKVGEVGDYYELKGSIDFTDWLEYFTEGIIDEMLRVKKDLEIRKVTPKTQIQIHHNKVLAYIEKHGFITDRDYSKMTDRAKATRALDFKKLIKLGYISRKGKGRNTYYVLKEQ